MRASGGRSFLSSKSCRFTQVSPFTFRGRLGAFGFATDIKELMKEMDGATNYLKLLKSRYST
jgi:hypothetical protein